MPVQNFLEDEEYEDQPQHSSVPDFLQDEDYESEQGDEYYGGGFSDGIEPGDPEDGFHEGFLSADEEDEELFDGGDLFAPAGGQELREAEDDSPYGISGLPQRVALPTVSTTVLSSADTLSSGGSTAPSTVATTPPSPGSSTVADPGASELSGSVPNFLADEDEEDSSAPGASAPVDGSGSIVGDSSSVTDVSAQGVPSVASGGAQQQLRPRRDLSRRPQQESTTVSNAGGTERDAVAEATPELRVEPTDTTGSSTETSTTRGAPTTTVRFDPRAKVNPVSEAEAAELKAPSSYASERELKYTALLQKDATIRRVGEDGLTQAERLRSAKRAQEEGRIRTPSNGKLAQEELLFYANLGAQRAADFGGVAKKELFLPPALGEDLEQKKAREARINRALAAGSMAHGSKTRLTEKDYRVLQFMAIFKFVSERQIAKLLQVAEHSAYKRLNLLRKHGLTKAFKVLGVRGSVWVLTETGMDLSGYELPRGTESALTLSMVSHQFTVNHVAAHLWAGGANVLREKNFPQRNRPDGSGGFSFGEQLISELQIQSAFGKVRGTSKADAYVPQIQKHMANQFDNWKRAGGAEFGPSPEFIRGNEYMWTLFPPISNRLNYHVPDLIVARPRSADGKPQSIAVEIELKTKADDASYERTLDAYRTDSNLFRKVVWICRLKGTAEKLSEIAKRNGLADQGRIAIVPIYLEDGSRFTGKDTWSL